MLAYDNDSRAAECPGFQLTEIGNLALPLTHLVRPIFSAVDWR